MGGSYTLLSFLKLIFLFLKMGFKNECIVFKEKQCMKIAIYVLTDKVTFFTRGQLWIFLGRGTALRGQIKKIHS